MFLVRSNLIISVLLVCIPLFQSCGGSGGDDDSPVIKPSNLSVEAVIQGKSDSNPNGDGTGIVNLNFSANNATSYVVNMGDDSDNITLSSTTLSYTYSTFGTKTYSIYVSAYNGNQFISTSITITVWVDSGSSEPGLVWSEEFNYTGSPNSSIWNFETGNNNGWGNNEVQYYTNRESNVRVDGSALIITAKAESQSGFDYTSARITTQDKFDFKYKRVEVRAKLPDAKGTWPAIWLLGANFSSVGWPHCGEIDIMEQTGWDKNTVLGTCHWWDNSGNHKADYGTTTSVSNVSSEWHIYKLEWTEQNITISVDDDSFYTMNTNSGMPFNQNFFMILNIAMGGNLGGDIDSGFTESTMEIDYIRVYE